MSERPSIENVVTKGDIDLPGGYVGTDGTYWGEVTETETGVIVRAGNNVITIPREQIVERRPA